MLNHKQLLKLNHLNHNTYAVNIYWADLCNQEYITELQWQTMISLADMSKDEQSKYVIVEDQLVLAPTKRKIYCKIGATGEWRRNKSYENTFKDK